MIILYTLSSIGFFFLAREIGIFPTKKPPKNWRVTSLKHPIRIAHFEVEGYLCGVNKNGFNARGNPAFTFSPRPSIFPSFFYLETFKKNGKQHGAAAASTPFHPFFIRQFHCSNIPSEFNKKGIKWKKIWIKGFVIRDPKSVWDVSETGVEFDKFEDDLRTEGQGGYSKFSSNCPIVEIIDAGYCNKITLTNRLKHRIEQLKIRGIK